MTYFEGFVVPVAEANKDAYLKSATDFAPVVREMGVQRHLEAWDSDVPQGKTTDFRKAVEAKENEKVVFAWFEYADRSARDSTNQKMMADPRMAEVGANMPFDGKRMIMGGFEAIVEEGSAGGSYVNGFIVPVPRESRDSYREMNARHSSIFRQHGALRFVQAWGDDVMRGEVTDFYRAVKAEPNEEVVFAFIEWPSKQANDEAWEKIMRDERMQPSGDMPFDGKRMFWGGFEKILDTSPQQQVRQTPDSITA